MYEERSPLYYADCIQCPVAFFQGLDDRVVPPGQTIKMYEAVKARGLTTALVTFEGWLPINCLVYLYVSQ